MTQNLSSTSSPKRCQQRGKRNGRDTRNNLHRFTTMVMQSVLASMSSHFLTMETTTTTGFTGLPKLTGTFSTHVPLFFFFLLPSFDDHFSFLLCSSASCCLPELIITCRQAYDWSKTFTLSYLCLPWRGTTWKAGQQFFQVKKKREVFSYTSRYTTPSRW